MKRASWSEAAVLSAINLMKKQYSKYSNADTTYNLSYDEMASGASSIYNSSEITISLESIENEIPS